MPTVRSEFVEVVLFKWTSAGPKYLILQRAGTEWVYPNLWQFVTGRIDEGETGIEAAHRELKEETKLIPIRFWNVPFIPSFYDQAVDAVFLNPIFAAEVLERAEPQLSSEHQQYRWLDYEEARSLLVWPNNHDALRLIHTYIVAGKDVAQFSEVRLIRKE
jgi:8-oxo-dGTP pyrophosphatase MutT (NUDIX family)